MRETMYQFKIDIYGNISTLNSILRKYVSIVQNRIYCAFIMHFHRSKWICAQRRSYHKNDQKVLFKYVLIKKGLNCELFVNSCSPKPSCKSSFRKRNVTNFHKNVYKNHSRRVCKTSQHYQNVFIGLRNVFLHGKYTCTFPKR